jgi:uncharacterized protein YbcV (DUF1398 family)
MQIIHDTFAASAAGHLKFPEAVGALMSAGVESYFVDTARMEETAYLHDGSSVSHKMTLPPYEAARDFSADQLIAAIRDAQADRIRYPEFLQRATAADVLGYWAFLDGRHVVYMGRLGQQHVERFPDKN